MGRLETILGRLGTLLDRLGALLDRLGALLDRLGPLSGRLWGYLAALGSDREAEKAQRAPRRLQNGSWSPGAKGGCGGKRALEKWAAPGLGDPTAAYITHPWSAPPSGYPNATPAASHHGALKRNTSTAFTSTPDEMHPWSAPPSGVQMLCLPHPVHHKTPKRHTSSSESTRAVRDNPTIWARTSP